MGTTYTANGQKQTARLHYEIFAMGETESTKTPPRTYPLLMGPE